MGYGAFTASSYASYSTANSKVYNTITGRIDSGQVWKAVDIDPLLDPKKFKIRECVNSDEHPNTIPIILGLDVTGSMGRGCQETAEALGVIMTNLYEKFKDIEFCIMGIGDLAYDDAPIQMSQYESDVRIAEALDKLYMEHGGGGNGYESYTAAWYMGLKRTKLDCFDKQNRKGIIITMGDEPLNPYLPKKDLNKAINGSEQANIETNKLFNEASEKFDIFHIAINDDSTRYKSYKAQVDKSFKQLLKERFKVSTINDLAKTIEECITASVQGNPDVKISENGEISW